MRKVLVILCFFLLCAVPPVSFAKNAAVISSLSGSVSYRDRDNVPYRTVKKGTPLGVGYWVKTGDNGWTVVTLSDGSKLTLANNTELKITKFMAGKKRKEGIFSILQGKLRAAIVHLSGETVDYKVQSRTAVAGIKGTEFMMMAQGQANVFFGDEGVAGISGGATSAKPLGAGAMVQNTRGFTPVDAVKVAKGTPLEAAKKNFEAITAATPPKDWELSNNLPNIIARWNINYGHYLADSGKYDDALYVFQIALDLTALPEIRSDARLEKATVYSRFLKNPEAALAQYLLVLEEYPGAPQRETALFQAGMTLYEMGFKGRAKERLLQYKREYPYGRDIGNVDTFLNELDK